MADDGGLASEYAASEERVKKPRKRWSLVETEARAVGADALNPNP